MLAVLRAVAALLEPRVCGRERRRNTTAAADLEFKLLSRPQGAATRAPADARIAAVQQELVGNASARAVLDPRLYGAFFPKDSTEVRTRTRASEQPPSGVHAEASQLVRCMDAPGDEIAPGSSAAVRNGKGIGKGRISPCVVRVQTVPYLIMYLIDKHPIFPVVIWPRKINTRC